MLSFTEEPWGKLKSCIIRKWPGSRFGTKPSGEKRIKGEGGLVNGPAIRPAVFSADSLSHTAWGLLSADAWLLGISGVEERGGMLEWSLKPNLKPFARYERKSSSYERK